MSPRTAVAYEAPRSIAPGRSAPAPPCAPDGLLTPPAPPLILPLLAPQTGGFVCFVVGLRRPRHSFRRACIANRVHQPATKTPPRCTALGQRRTTLCGDVFDSHQPAINCATRRCAVLDRVDYGRKSHLHLSFRFVLLTSDPERRFLCNAVLDTDVPSTATAVREFRERQASSGAGQPGQSRVGATVIRPHDHG